jgi:hypothetical protein
VNLAGKDIYLDPGTRFCPYGYLRWIRTSTMGLKLDKKGGVFVTASAAGYDKAITRRTAEMALDSDGNLKRSHHGQVRRRRYAGASAG